MQVELARLEEIFAEALSHADASARTAYLDQACGENAELRRRVEALITSHESCGDFLKLPNGEQADAASGLIVEGPGTKIGNYKLLEQIGEGGFAVVFMAEQLQPVRRRVALKIIKLGMDTRQIVARFEAERQALAMMDHPGIAKVFDAGTTGARSREPGAGGPDEFLLHAPGSSLPAFSGRPYFVMELVKGVPITEYCDEHQLGIDDRLVLFTQVCEAVQHAHQKGVIHRDIKPSNVLVSTQDGRPLAKVIDFGIAKATQTLLTDRTLFTDFRQLIGTPAYMSPEQADGSLDIDTRSDVYSLGVLLYEMLAGTPPFDPKELRSKSFAEVQRIIREVEPEMPSRRLSSRTSDELIATASQRRTDPKRLMQLVRGDIDWIVMRCLEKDRGRRYPTASSLADDIGRFRDHRPIEAHGRTWMYALRKFVRRNKVAVLAGSAVVAALAIGLAAATIGFVQASRQAEFAHARAVRNALTTQFLKDTLKAAGLEHESQLAELDNLFDDSLLQTAMDQAESARLFRLRATLRSRIGHWTEATNDFLRANEIALDGAEFSFDSAIVLLKSGHIEDYRDVCHAYLARVDRNRDFASADMAAKVALLLPVEGPDFELACALADYASTDTAAGHLACVHLCKALAEYRRGHFESAVKWGERAIVAEGITPRLEAAVRFIQAAAYTQLRQFERAENAWARGDEMLNRPRDTFTSVYGDTWCDFVIAEHLRREASELVGKSSGPRP